MWWGFLHSSSRKLAAVTVCCTHTDLLHATYHNERFAHTLYFLYGIASNSFANSNNVFQQVSLSSTVRSFSLSAHTSKLTLQGRDQWARRAATFLILLALLVQQDTQVSLYTTCNMTSLMGNTYDRAWLWIYWKCVHFQKVLWEHMNISSASKESEAQMHKNIQMHTSRWLQKQEHHCWPKLMIKPLRKLLLAISNIIIPSQHHLLPREQNTQFSYPHWNCSKATHQTEKSLCLDTITNATASCILQWKKKVFVTFS